MLDRPEQSGVHLIGLPNHTSEQQQSDSGKLVERIHFSLSGNQDFQPSVCSWYCTAMRSDQTTKHFTSTPRAGTVLTERDSPGALPNPGGDRITFLS